jgi:hypothetical protein
MIVWGYGGDVLNLGTLETRSCPTCEKDRPFNVFLQYRYWGLYWVFNCVVQKKYTLLCQACQRGWELDKSKIQGALKKVPIPFMRQFGLLLLIAIVAGLGILGALS